jgi:hypothetical protein
MPIDPNFADLNRLVNDAEVRLAKARRAFNAKPTEANRNAVRSAMTLRDNLFAMID